MLLQLQALQALVQVRATHLTARESKSCVCLCRQLLHRPRKASCTADEQASAHVSILRNWPGSRQPALARRTIPSGHGPTAGTTAMAHGLDGLGIAYLLHAAQSVSAANQATGDEARMQPKTQP